MAPKGSATQKPGGSCIYIYIHICKTEDLANGFPICGCVVHRKMTGKTIGFDLDRQIS